MSLNGLHYLNFWKLKFSEIYFNNNNVQAFDHKDCVLQFNIKKNPHLSKCLQEKYTYLEVPIRSKF